MFIKLSRGGATSNKLRVTRIKQSLRSVDYTNKAHKKFMFIKLSRGGATSNKLRVTRIKQSL
ncbi:MAG: hypothetical protein KBT36_12765, partial [Kurthia sp.]|nr:hypothetical protein [Candidatus Kurthia equi]